MAAPAQTNHRQLVLLTVLVCIMAVGGIYMYVFAPQARNYYEVKDKVDDANSTLMVNVAKLKQASRAQEELDNAVSQLAAFESMVPEEDRVHYVYRDLEAIAKANGVEIVDITTGQPKERGRYNELPMTCDLVGRYEDLLGFIDSLEATPRIVNAKSFSVQGGAALPGLGEQEPLPPGEPSKGALPVVLKKDSLVSFKVDMVTYVKRKGGDASAAQPK